jgi:predicted lipoprotein with Yx(FWY)xxD motif
MRSSAVRRAGLGSVLVACGVLVVAGCSSSSKSVAAGVTTTAGATSTAGATVLLASNGVLTDANGMTLYTFDSDTAGATTSACTGACAQAWPALTATGAPTAGPGVTGPLTTISGGQVSWNGHPLYRWMGDKKPGDATGDGINGFHVAKATATAGTGPTTTAAPASGY